MSHVVLAYKGVETLKNRHPWVFRGAIKSLDARPGDVVDILDENRKLLGRGFYSAQSQIAVRVLTFFSDESIDSAFFEKRIADAIAYRQTTVVDANAYRLISSEADFFPGLIVDRYADHLVIQTVCPGTEKIKNDIVALLKKHMDVACVVERNDVGARELEGLEKTKGILFGSLNPALEIQEGRIVHEVNLLEGQKTGAFLDQRENHVTSARYARGRVFDGFCYQGGFALHEALAAESVLAVDSSERAIAAAVHNAKRNRLTRLECRKGKVYDVLGELYGQQQFQMVSIDPPAFAKSKRDVESAKRAYREINARAIQVVEPGGYLLTCSCSYHMTENIFLEVLTDASRKAKRDLRLVEKRTQAADHPILLTMPESYYLKCLIFQVW